MTDGDELIEKKQRWVELSVSCWFERRESKNSKVNDRNQSYMLDHYYFTIRSIEIWSKYWDGFDQSFPSDSETDLEKKYRIIDS